MLRMLRAARIFRKWESSIEINYNHLALAKFGVIVFFMAHWLACLWHMTIIVQELTDVDAVNWVDFYPNLSREDSVLAQYVASLYWAVITLSKLGYGDIVPVTTLERAFTIVAAIVGASLYAYLVGAVCGILMHMGKATQAFYQEMDLLNAFMRDKHIPQVCACVPAQGYHLVNSGMARGRVWEWYRHSSLLQAAFSIVATGG